MPSMFTPAVSKYLDRLLKFSAGLNVENNFLGVQPALKKREGLVSGEMRL